MSEFKYVCIPVRSEQEGIETAEDVIGAMMWNNDEHKRPQAWPYDNDNPIIVMDSPLLLEKQLAESQAETQELYRQLATELKAEHAEELAEMRAEIERLKGVVISQITPEPVVLSSYSTSTEPAKDERDKLIEQMRDALRLLRCCGNCLHCTSYDHMGADAQYCELDVNDFEEGQTCKELDKWEPQTEPIKSALAAERGE